MGQMGPALMRVIETQLTGSPSYFQSCSYHPVPANCSVGHLIPVLKISLQLFLYGAALSLGPAGCGLEPLGREEVIYVPLLHFSTCLSRCVST